MTVNKFLQCAVLVASALVLCACTSSGKLRVARAPSNPLPHDPSILVEVTSDLDDARKAAIQLEATVALLAREQLLVRQAVTARLGADAPATLRLEARIVHLRQVTFIKDGVNKRTSGWRRPRVIADVFLVDVASDAVLAQFTAEGWGALGKPTEDAIRRTAEQIVRFLAEDPRTTRTVL
jgi:hypothetical protein